MTERIQKPFDNGSWANCRQEEANKVISMHLSITLYEESSQYLEEEEEEEEEPVTNPLTHMAIIYNIATNG